MKPAHGITVVRNGSMIDGTGAAPVADATVIANNGMIDYAGPSAGAPEIPPDAKIIDANSGTILPGLVEAHYHATYFNVSDLQDLDIRFPVEYVTIRAVKNAKTAFEAGYTAARSGGSLFNIDVWLKQAIEEDMIAGPSPLCGRTRDLRRRGPDGLEPRLPQDRHGRLGSAH